MKRLLSGKVLGIVLAVLAIGGYIFVSWASDALPADGTALQALESDEQVVVKEESGLITFEPVNAEFDTGFIFYPGGRVDYRAYAPVLSQIAGRRYFVALVPMPLNMALFNVDAANQVIELYPGIQQWAVGGHSLGGVAASRFVANETGAVQGVVLWAAYPGNDSLANADIKVMSIYGTNDIAGMEPFDESRAQLPVDTEFVVIEGGNHAQFGSYGPQPGDNPATISPEEQWTQIAEATVRFLESLNNE
ncbi:MAG TPA: alpha/beta hydrolase [Anaerolineales bacterium]|nr:alpha/beta hydrolase [Anaerolineales bacterium]